MLATEEKLCCHDPQDPRLGGSHSRLTSARGWQSALRWSQDPSRKVPGLGEHQEESSLDLPEQFIGFQRRYFDIKNLLGDDMLVITKED